MKARNSRVLLSAKHALAAFAAAAAFAAFADSVTTNDVMAVVRGWQNAGEALGERLTAEPESVKEYSGLGGTGTYYVVSFAGGGYVVTSGDTAFEPVLAYSRNGSWVEDEAQNPLKAMVEIDIAAATTAELGSAGSSGSGSAGKSGGQRLAAAATSASASGGKAAKWEKFKAAGGTKKSGQRLRASAPSSDLRVAPLVTTAWNQSDANGRTCWNKYTPGNYVCGCVATMAAQLMRYWAWPDAAHKLPAQRGYSGSVGSSGGWNLTQGYRLSSDEAWQPWAVTPFDTSVAYDWANMPDTPTTDAHCAAMGRFLLDVGLSVYMNYTSGGSGTQLSFVGKRLTDQYAYRNAVVRQSGLTASERDNAILASLDAKLPCCVAVSRTGGAHAIVADGYGYDGEKTLYIHFNMGWGSVGTDTWYTPPNVGSYTSLYSVIYNIYPPTDKDGIAREAGLSIVSGTLLDNAGSPLGGATVTAYNRTTDETVTATTAASTGRFVLWLPAGSYSISAASGGYTALYTKRIETIGDPLDDAGWVKDAGIVGNIHGLELKLETPAATPTASTGDIAEFYYPNTLAVTLSAASGATIHYTLDGSEPTDESPIYDGPIVLSETTTVRARAYADGMSPSAVMTQTFTRNEYLYKDVPDVYFDYAESSGTQWVDTGIDARSGTKVELESAQTYAFYTTPFGIYSTRKFSGNAHMMPPMPGLNRFRVFNKNAATPIEAKTDANVFQTLTYEVDTTGKCYCNYFFKDNGFGVVARSVLNDAGGAYDIGGNLYAFAANNLDDGGLYGAGTFRIRRFRIWQTAAYNSGSDYALVRDFRPCGKLQEDGTYKVGLYDAVSGIIFYPQGGSLAYGKILSYVEEPQELYQYVSNDGASYIDTGVIGHSGTKAEINYKGGAGHYASILGGLGSANSYHMIHMCISGTVRLFYQSGSPATSGIVNGTTTFHHTVVEWGIDGTGGLTIDGTEHALFTGITAGSTGLPMYMFACNNKGPVGFNASASIYGCKIMQKATESDDYALMRDFRPCKGARGVGFYDAVTKSIFYPEGGTLTAGTVIAVKAEPKQLYQRYNANAAASFDLGLKMRSGTKMEMRGFGVWANVGLMAVKDGTGAEYGLIKDANNMIAITAGSVTNSTTKGGNGGHQVVKAEFALDGGLSVIANGDSLVTSAGAPFDTGLNFYLFGKNNNGSNATTTYTEFWGARIWQTDENGVYQLVRDLWPCADESGVSGLYDRVSGMIFYSFTGTAGGLIDLLAVREEPSAYLQSVSSGSGQYIDTAVEAKSGTKTEVSISKCTTTGHYAVLGAIGDPRSYHMLLVANGTAFRTFYPSATSDQSTGDVSAGDLTGTTVRNIVSEWGADGNVRVTLNGTETSLSTSGAEFDTGITLYLFDGNRYRRSTGITIHGARLWQVGEDGEYTLMRDYRPCLGNGPGGATPGTPGLYDSVSGMIFYSPSGTPLTAGPVISKKAEPAEFIQYVGSTNYVDGVMQHAYVDTGVVGRSGTKAEVAFTGWTDYNTAIFGCRQGGNHFLWFKNGYSSLRFIYKGTSQYETLPCGDNTYNVLAVGVGEDGSATVSINGTEYAGDIVSQGAYSSGLNAYLLAGNAEGGATWNVNARIYSAKIWQTDESGDYALVRDYRPCKDSDGVAGLYDAVSGHIFYSASGTPLAAGPSLMKAEEPTKLYSYVESSGTQYIDTGVVGRQNTTVEVRFTGWTGNFTALYGAIGSSGVHYLGFHNWGYYRFIYGPSGDGGDYMKSIAFGDDTLNTVRSDVTADGAITLTVNGGATAVPLTMGAQTTLLNMYLFAGNSRGSVYQPATAKVYACRIWQDGELVRDFYPCEGSEGVGLYDAVNGNIHYPLGGMLEHGADLMGATARWIGETPSSAADFENPNNWRILAADGVTKIDGVVPNKGMDVIVDGDVGYSFTSAVPWPVSSWKSLTFGPGAITLTSDCDWSGVGTVALEAGTTIDLSGHILTVGGFASSSAETVSILNSGDMATVSFAVADGGTSAVNGFTFAGDILFAKTGNGSVSLRPSKFVLAADAEFQFSGVSLDLSGTTLELADPDGLAGNFVFATSDAAIAGNPTASNLPKGWKVKKSADGKSLSVVKIRGVMIIAK